MGFIVESVLMTNVIMIYGHQIKGFFKLWNFYYSSMGSF